MTVKTHLKPVSDFCLDVNVDLLPESVLCAVENIEWRLLRGVPHQPAWICIIEFNANAFDSAAFLDAGIKCPTTIQRSVLTRQAEFFFGRLAARYALSVVGVKCDEIPIGAAREPVWPSLVTGSITHNQNFAMAVALRQSTNVGIDVERVLSTESQQAVLAVAISANEQAYLRTLTVHLPFDHLVTAVFSAKESFFKAAYASVGRYFDFSALEVVGFDSDQLCYFFVVKEALSSDFFSGKIVRVQLEYVRPDTLLSTFFD